MAESHRRTIDLLGTTVEYNVCHSADATEPRIDVDIHGITVVVPVSEEVQPMALLEENAAWVIDKQRRYDNYREQAPDRTFEAGECFPVLGDDRELVIESRQSHELTQTSIRLRVSAVEQSSVEQALENFYRSRARDYLTDRVDQYAEQMDVGYETIELRNQRTRWGAVRREARSA